MGVREDLLTWVDGITDPLVGPVTELGQVYDDVYAERKIAVNSLLGIVEDDVNNTVELNYDNSGLKTRLGEAIDGKVLDIETTIEPLLTVKEV